MAKDTKAVTSGSTENVQEPETLAEYLTKPDAPGVSTPPAPEMSDGAVPVTSKVIDGLFEEKWATAKETEKQSAEQDKAAQEVPAAGEDAPKKGRGGRPPKTDKAEKSPETDKADKPKKAERAPRLPKGPKEEKQAGGAGVGGVSGKNAGKEETASEPPPPPRDVPRSDETEGIVYIAHADLHPFKGHPFQVRDDEAMKSLVESVKERGFDQPALVRPREGGGYELVAGHRRQHAAELAGYTNLPCVVRNLTDDEAVLAMTESNLTTRESILPSERAKALQMQLEAIKHQGAKNGEVKNGELGKRSNEIIADRNQMSIKNVQRYIALNNLVPDLMKQVDANKVKFSAAVDLSYIKPKNQRYIAVAIDAQQSAPSGAQAQRMRELDQKGVLNGDVIDGIMLEEKKEETRVILNSQELAKYFGPEKSPQEMKDTILKLLDEYKEKQPPELSKPEKKQEVEK